MLEEIVGLATAECREPASSDRLPSIGVSLQPAIPRRVGHRQYKLNPDPARQSNAMLNLAAWVAWSRPPSAAKGVSFLLCTPGDISTLRRQRV